MTKPYYEDEFVTLYHGAAEDVLPTLDRVDHFIADPPYSAHVHGAARSRIMRANDRGTGPTCGGMWSSGSSTCPTI